MNLLKLSFQRGGWMSSPNLSYQPGGWMSFTVHPQALSAAEWPAQTQLSFPYQTWPGTRCPYPEWLVECTRAALKYKYHRPHEVHFHIAQQDFSPTQTAEHHIVKLSNFEHVHHYTILNSAVEHLNAAPQTSDWCCNMFRGQW